MVRAFLGLLLCTLASLTVSDCAAEAQTFHFKSDQLSTADGGALCLAVDTTRPLAPAPGASVVPIEGGAPFPLTDTFYPVVAQRCEALDASLPDAWQPSDTRELRIAVKGQPMCLSARGLTSFTPLLDPFLTAFKADETPSFAYLTQDLKPGGVINAKRLSENPDFVVGPCGRIDAGDSWQYDDISGTISGPNLGGGRRQCVTIHGDWSKRPVRYESGMPVSAAACPNVRTFRRADHPRFQLWRTGTGRESLPTFPVLPEPGYFSGAEGLPIAGPLGRCLTANGPDRRVGTSQCDGRVEQNWIMSGSAIRRGPRGDCLATQPDGRVATAACDGKPGQQWRYHVTQPEPNPGWQAIDVYGQITADEDGSRCLAVEDDPFVDPSRQNNPLRVVPCASIQTRRTSWFMADHVQTIRLAILRFSDDDGADAAMGKASDATVKAIAEGMATGLSDYYRVLGVRFVFDPDHDLMDVKNTAANQMMPKADRLTMQIAGNTLYGKAVVAIMAKMGGGSSCGRVADYDWPALRDPVSGQSLGTRRPIAEVPLDAAGLPAYCRTVNESFVSSSTDAVGQESHEFGHFFGLAHTFDPGGFRDIPPDTLDGTWWHQHGSDYCGNARSGIVKGVRYTPDRINNESYWGCLIGRSHTSFSPLQLGRMLWSLKQLNRYPLVACQPTQAYDANHMECENDESLARCRETAAYLKATTGTNLACQAGGRVVRAMRVLLQSPVIAAVLQTSPDGVALTKRLAGIEPQAPLSLSSLGKTVDALQSCTNLPLCMALVTRFTNLQTRLATMTPSPRTGGRERQEAGSGENQRALFSAAREQFSPDFVNGVPRDHAELMRRIILAPRRRDPR